MSVAALNDMSDCSIATSLKLGPTIRLVLYVAFIVYDEFMSERKRKIWIIGVIGSRRLWIEHRALRCTMCVCVCLCVCVCVCVCTSLHLLYFRERIKKGAPAVKTTREYRWAACCEVALGYGGGAKELTHHIVSDPYQPGKSHTS